EIIDPVVEGSVRARQDRRIDRERKEVMPVLIHGDASIAGQGVVYETFNLAQTRGYATGGTIHIVVNNRIGFTLSNPLDAHSLLYCTDIGKVVQAPILHVNGDDPEAVAFAVQLAVDFRMEFRKDVVIDLICYRKYGHNEADEPAATQPMMYKKIREHPGVRAKYASLLVERGELTEPEVEQLTVDYRDALDAGHQVSDFELGQEVWPPKEGWHQFQGHRWDEPTKTALPSAMLKELGNRINTVPPDIKLHPRVSRIVNDRLKMVAGGLPMDWGCAETLAYATLLHEGFSVRISGQDSGRGTFFHRHAVLHNQRTGDSHIPLQHVAPEPTRFTIIDSILSEEAVLGFEFGYSTTDPQTMVVWEAQFGDFVNVAQVVIDQFICSSEVKWGRLSGMVLMLPHGWEGQGPEHSSARLERFMQLCAQENIQVCHPTTPAQIFHMLRRQMIRQFRKPLIIMSPKSLLRRKISFTSLDDLCQGRFQVVIGEVDEMRNEDVERVVLCSGKVYYDLLEERRKTDNPRVALVRIEQLYPFPRVRLMEELERYANAKELVWAQEEPMNQGAWYSIQHHLRECMRQGQSLGYAGRLSSPSPSGGSYKLHLERQSRLVEAALNLSDKGNRPIVVLSQPCFGQAK
ncbi:MAG: 2-oxoglutarate dehydrogenase E1 component, partial [Verrucomicrobia bacterium]|nr:2-oxoglutarate dehydrogenase E1 component [Verrucomicrobiota bacterium]